MFNIYLQLKMTLLDLISKERNTSVPLHSELKRISKHYGKDSLTVALRVYQLTIARLILRDKKNWVEKIFQKFPTECPVLRIG